MTQELSDVETVEVEKQQVIDRQPGPLVQGSPAASATELPLHQWLGYLKYAPTEAAVCL